MCLCATACLPLPCSFFADVWMLFPKEEEYIEW